MSHPSSPSALDPLFVALQQALAGRYSIDRELGRGGMGIVYLAREVHLDRLVAIKLLPPDLAAQPHLRERFLREARTAAKLSHPNIIPIHAVEDAGGFVFYVMAFVDGETLAQRVQGRGPLPATEGTRVLRDVAWALSYAHGQGLVHRDVKPDNILIERATNRVLVADFGIAAAFGDAEDGVTGTPEFMSPEQVLGKPLDARSDLYSLGATAYFAFTGRFPFEGTSATEVLAKQVTENAAPLASMGTAVPRKVASLIDRCLAKEPANRPTDSQALAEQLGTALEKRRELPVALRAFAKRGARLNGPGTILWPVVLLPVSTAVSAWFGGWAGFGTLLLGATIPPFAYCVQQARRLLSHGFVHSDIEPAFHAENEQTREELSASSGGPSSLERGVTTSLKVSAAVTIASVPLVLVRAFTHLPIPAYRFTGFVATIAALSYSATVLLGLAKLALLQRHRDVDGEFWAKMWNGPIGKSAFRIAKRLLRGRVQESAITHRATELSVGLAAEQLFESLSKDTRQALGDLPALLTRLQHDAQRLRERHDVIQEALAAAGEAVNSPEFGDTRAVRDELRTRLSETVGALETIRLNLLRLHAGSATVEGLTTHLGIAADVSEQVERLIAAHADVEQALRFPERAEPTPV